MPPEPGVQPGDVGGVHAEEVSQELIIGTDLDHRVPALVAAGNQQMPQVPQVDHGDYHVEADHRPDPEGPVVGDQQHGAHQVQQAQPQDPGLQQGPDQYAGPGPADRVKP